ncbi:VWA domain-containing protein [Terriglobus saanensis]|uniref:VWFA-related domain-containing protein n=1 Tax=Terriglobus saanensis (strain ATCC BAA-1853 / DSM 23119 / SP1PR4) TaxID=401053 RepID=E8V859_TERSS|nr:VWA domain-containing protein [Terriglobus saanensis]ADV84041.1 VWFA-related domain-containing protein [Terriglobus saanensis SP1PR4]
MRRTFALFFLALGIPCVAQQPAAPSVPASAAQVPPLRKREPDLRVSARLVYLDVVVTDHSGQPVPDLKVSDFKLTEDRANQRITSFTEHVPATAKLAPNPLPPNTFMNTPADLQDTSRTVLLFDTVNTPITAQMYARTQILKYLDARPANAPIAVFLLDTQLHLLHGFNDDPSDLQSGKLGKKLQPRQSMFLNSGGGSMPGERQVRAQFREDALRNSFRSLATYLSAFPGRKNLIWLTSDVPVGQNYGFDPANFDLFNTFTADMNGLANDLNLGRVAIYPIDARGLTVDSGFDASHSGPPALNSGRQTFQLQRNMLLDDFARRTGGKAFYNTNGISQAIDEVETNGGRYYTLTYAPTNPNWRGEMRRIDLQVDKPGYSLNYRRNYLARTSNPPPPSSKPDPKAPPVAPPDALHSAMALGAIAPFDIRFRVQTSLDPKPVDRKTLAADPGTHLKGKWQKESARIYTLHYEIDTRNLQLAVTPDGHRTGSLQVLATIYDDLGQLANSAVANLNLNFTSAEYERLQKVPLSLDQKIAVPIKSNFFLRLGVHDVPSDRIGALQVSVDAIGSPAP